MSNGENIYFTHDNGNRPFKVVINKVDKVIDVFCRDEEKFNEHYDNLVEYDQKVYTTKYSTYFIGKSPKNSMTEFSGGYGKKFDGNSMLVKLSRSNTSKAYLYIGREIFTFRTIHDIEQYVSPVGNNDVPYPYAIDTCGNYYLLGEEVILSKNDLNKELFNRYDDPYHIYYKLNLITPDTAYVNPELPFITNFNNIAKYHIGREQFTLTYKADPANTYDRNIKKGSKKTMSTTDTNGVKTILTRDGYIALMEEFGEKAGFLPMYKQVYVDRRI
jgi:hypothetical protein